ncbi:hypothetical protein B1812_06860 [Methylocystis bryophila]|uniref:Uncharacterized protein n=1 Tax=Methylocystis bryophila TaxID=655015 RepID=A0A1W6MTG9_9HYPH|nr:hypothetical protein B1812_06860 [Methylocystis bryophila]
MRGLRVPASGSAKFHRDHAAFGRNRLSAENVIDSKSLERDLCEKTVSNFSHRALIDAAIV